MSFEEGEPQVGSPFGLRGFIVEWVLIGVVCTVAVNMVIIIILAVRRMGKESAQVDLVRRRLTSEIEDLRMQAMNMRLAADRDAFRRAGRYPLQDNYPSEAEVEEVAEARAADFVQRNFYPFGRANQAEETPKQEILSGSPYVGPLSRSR